MNELSKLKPDIKFIISLLVVTTCSFFAASQPGNSDFSLQQKIDSALQETKDLNFEYISTIQDADHQIPITAYFFKNINEIPDFCQTARNKYTDAKYNIQTLFHYSFQMLGATSGGYGPPLQGTPRSYTVNNREDLSNFFDRPGIELSNEEEWKKLPYLFQKSVVEMLVSVDEVQRIFKQFSKPVQDYLKEKSAFHISEIYSELIIPWDQKELLEFSSVDMIKKADLKKLSFSTRKLSEILNSFLMQKDLHLPEDFKSCSIRSPMGELLINGIKNDTIQGGQTIVIELGGDDVYLENTASPKSFNMPVGIVVDLHGNDKYLSKDHFLVAGILGIAFLLDLEGDDYYQTNKPGLAFSLYGSSLLYDYSGNDVYIGINRSQAASYVGSSLLIDISGDDRYYCRSYSQAFGGTFGVGILFDNKGNDHYNSIAIGETEYHNQQNFVLGAASGRWAEATDGQSLAGGIGFFIDNSGTDDYDAGSFSQGASYYYGLGIFCEKEGKDTYNAFSHSQGYAAHYSLACFYEQQGDDTYNANTEKNKITQIIGGGRDFSAGIFLEMHGNDTYHFGNRSAGIGDINGVGLLFDFTGNDKYIWHKNTINSGSYSLGKTIGLAEGLNVGCKILQPPKVLHKGIFIDSNGDNTFK